MKIPVKSINLYSDPSTTAVSSIELTAVVFTVAFLGFVMALLSLFPSKIQASSTPYPDSTFRILRTGAGPEDMVIDSAGSSPRILVSCASRRDGVEPYGEIEAIDPATGKRTAMKRNGEPSPMTFRPHGLSLIKAGEIQYLYVISHDDKKNTHPVIRYQIDGDTLQFVELLESRLLVSPNALQAFADGSLFVCNDSGKRNDMKEKIMRQKKGNILYYDGRGNWSIAARQIGMPAGLSALGNQLFVSAALENRMYSFTISDGQLTGQKILNKVKGPDNIRLSAGKLIVTSHSKPLKFIAHTRKASAKSPSLVLSVDPETGKYSKLFGDSGKIISAASVAVVLKNDLIIGQIFEPDIIVIPTVR